MHDDCPRLADGEFTEGVIDSWECPCAAVFVDVPNVLGRQAGTGEHVTTRLAGALISV